MKPIRVRAIYYKVHQCVGECGRIGLQGDRVAHLIGYDPDHVHRAFDSVLTLAGPMASLAEEASNGMSEQPIIILLPRVLQVQAATPDGVIVAIIVFVLDDIHAGQRPAAEGVVYLSLTFHLSSL